MNETKQGGPGITMGDIARAINDGNLRPEFVVRVRVNFETDEEALKWLARPNPGYHNQTPWEMYYGNPGTQGWYIDATCNIFVKKMNKRNPNDLPAI